MSIKAIISDFSRVLLFPVDDSYSASLNNLNRKLLVEDDNYNFSEYFRLNTELMKLYEKFKENRKLYIFTSDEIQNHVAVRGKLDKVFDDVISAKLESISKTDPQAYLYVCRRFRLEPDEAVYIDDQQKNLDAAEKAGLMTVLYLDNEKLEQRLAELLK